jgi:hypothetical protein
MRFRIGLPAVLLGVAVALALVLATQHGDGMPSTRTAGAGLPGDPAGGGNVERSLLTYAQLTTPQSPALPVDDGAFKLPAAAAMPQYTFEGRLKLTSAATGGGFKDVLNCPLCGRQLPPFSIDLVQTGSYLVPARQGLLITKDNQDGSTYNLIVGPGRAWKENTDTGSAGSFSRASLPFTLVDRNQNCTHNGELSFLFNTSAISYVRYQVTAETCAPNQFDMWGQLSATYSPHTVANDTAIRAAEAAELADRIPIKPLSALASDYPGSGIDLTVLGSGITPSAMSVYGVVYKGVNYVADGNSPNKGCQTRYGTYAFCYEMRLPSYSTAKSAFAGLALARLAQDFPTADVPNLLLRSYVPEMASRSTWRRASVTLDDAADMATGNYRAASYETDEADLNTWNFLSAEPYGTATSGKMGYALAYPHHGSEQGRTWVYHTVDHFLLTQAETGFLQSQRGASADLFDTLRDEVYRPIHLTAGALTTERTDNAAAQSSSPTKGRPWGAYGLFFTVDDVAKLATLFQSNGGYGGTQLLDRTQTLAAMQRLTADPGVAAVSANLTGNGDGTVSAGGYRYSNGLWAYPTTNAVPGCALRIPFMSGYGGITIAMLPNGASYYYFSDGKEFSWPIVGELNKLAPMCAATKTVASASPLTQTTGRPVTLSVSVSSATRSWAPTGTVQFEDNGVKIGPNILLDGDGKASYTTTALSRGSHTITAVYAPDLTRNTSISSSPAVTTLSGTCSASATTCRVDSTAGMKVGDTIAMGLSAMTDDIHVISALTPTSISWVGAFQSTSHAAAEPVWLQDTAGGGFATSTSPGVTVAIG